MITHITMVQSMRSFPFLDLVLVDHLERGIYSCFSAICIYSDIRKPCYRYSHGKDGHYRALHRVIFRRMVKPPFLALMHRIDLETFPTNLTTLDERTVNEPVPFGPRHGAQAAVQKLVV